MEHKITIASPFKNSPNADRYAMDPFYQDDLVRRAVRALLQDPFEKNVDLRGKEFRITVHPDGLHVTAEMVTVA